MYGYPLELAAPVAVRSVREAGTSVELVRFVLWDDRAHGVFAAAIQAPGEDAS